MNIICERCYVINCPAVPYDLECDTQYSPYLMVMKRPGDRFPIEYPCKDMHDLKDTYNIRCDSDEYEVEFYDETHQIFPTWAQ